MNAKATFTRPRVATVLVASGLSALITFGLFAAIVGAFQRAGTPFDQILTAEHACAQYAFVSERDTCARLYLVAPRIQNVASR